jgi:Tfp pilus assembly protein PilF
MGKSRQKLLIDSSIVFINLAVIVLLASCAMPKIVFIEDTLTAEQHNDLGYVYEKKGMDDLAEKEYSLAAKKRRNWQTPYFNLGNIHFKKGDFSKAEDFYRKALKLNPNNPDIMNNLANVLLSQDRFSEAREMVNMALLLQKKDAYIDTLLTIQAKESAAGHPLGNENGVE